MKVAAHLEKEKNEKTGKRKAAEEKRQATDFKEVECYPSAVVQGTARRKNGLCEGSARGNWNPREEQPPFRPKCVWGPHHHVEAAVDWCSSILLASHVYTIYTTETSHFTIQKDQSQYVFWGRTESR